MVEPAEKAGMRNAWGRVPEAYTELWAEHTAPISGAALDLLDGASGPALDVGCGPGHTTAALARRLDGGTALGVDFSPAMVEHARRTWAGTPGVAFEVDDAERLARPDAGFDVVAASYTLMYCYDATGALMEMARVVRPGGQLMLLVWGPARDVWWSPSIEIVERRAAYYSAACPMMFFYGLPSVLPRMCAQAGLEITAEAVLDAPMRYASAEDAVAASLIGGPLAGLYNNRLDEAMQREAWDLMRREVEAVAVPDGEGIALPGSSVAVVARKPG